FAPTLIDCTIEYNTAPSEGGGIFIYEGDATLTNCLISNNTATGVSGREGAGGGIALQLSNSAITNCLIYENEALGGAGVYLNASRPAITNCTIVDNAASTYDGGGILCYQAVPTFNNTIIWGNSTADRGNQLYTGSQTITLNNCDLQDSGLGSNDVAGVRTPIKNNCINSDPLFVNPVGDNYELQTTSPCIDAGNSSLVPSDVTTDLNDAERIQGAAVDLGAYECR
ncbi:MAG: right-handed parallel beta-helix repeat-containing protein, partial [Planctomycetota bacterium]